MSKATSYGMEGKPAATVGRQVFMVPLAFQRNRVTIPGMDNRDIDTATIVVHELFHVAGFSDPLIQSMNRDIHDSCGFKGMTY